MNKMKLKSRIMSFLVSVLLTGELAVVLDAISVWFGRALSVPKFALLCGLLFCLIHLVPWGNRKHKNLLAGAMTMLAVLLVVGVQCWYCVSKNAVYEAVDDGKAELYGGQKVMLFVPHQDDDINVLGGIMEEYVKYGSEVTVVFSTNGDYDGLAEVRFREAVAALDHVGIPEENIIFLGYGDQWEPGGPHLYNAEPGDVLTSYYGVDKTYGTEAHSVYREGIAYTVDNFLGTIQDLILEYRPDIIYCVDYDYHIDHRALSLALEKVMGQILQSEEDYTPLVFKGYAYSTAWHAEADFFAENLLSTQDPFSGEYQQKPEIYRWEDRIRLPMNGAALSRSLVTSGVNVAMAEYASQGAFLHSSRVINGDKVFWQRWTNSLCYDAEIETSTGDAKLLNDFMLLESGDLLEKGDEPYDGTWVPDEKDEERTAVVRFRNPEYIETIVLYDNPDQTGNIKNAQILFDDGTLVETGPMDPGGAATAITVGKAAVSSFAVTIVQGEGAAGFTEIEAYSAAQEAPFRFVKLMDEAGNFAYDYWINRGGTQRFLVYTSGMEEQTYILSCSNAECSAVWQDGTVLVECPTGESCVIAVSTEDGTVSDSICVRNPGLPERLWKMLWLKAEDFVLNACETKQLHERLFVCRLYTKTVAFLERLF